MSRNRTSRKDSLNIRVLPELHYVLSRIKKAPHTKFHPNKLVSDSDIIHQALYQYAQEYLDDITDNTFLNQLKQY